MRLSLQKDAHKIAPNHLGPTQSLNFRWFYEHLVAHKGVRLSPQKDVPTIAPNNFGPTKSLNSQWFYEHLAAHRGCDLALKKMLLKFVQTIFDPQNH